MHAGRPFALRRMFALCAHVSMRARSVKTCRCTRDVQRGHRSSVGHALPPTACCEAQSPVATGTACSTGKYRLAVPPVVALPLLSFRPDAPVPALGNAAAAQCSRSVDILLSRCTRPALTTAACMQGRCA